MENQNLERDLKAKFKKNWRLFKQSKLGMNILWTKKRNYKSL